MKNLFVLTPSDRFNYGDLLFSHIISHYFKRYVDRIVFCSTTDADLSELGGIPTRNFHVLYKLDRKDKNILFVGGGDSLCIGWPMVISFISPTINYFSALDHKLKTKLFENVYLKSRYGIKTMFPFSIGKNELENLDTVIYNSLGGSYLKENIVNHREQIKQLLSSVDYLSVRDKSVYEELNEININGNLVPDSAILMSEVFSEDFLLRHITFGLNGFLTRKYLFFQINKTLFDQNSDSYVRTIQRVLRETDFDVCLCPIGTALGHGDDEALGTLQSILSNSRVQLIQRPSVWDIMWLIKRSILYIGSSLHGAITAMSFGVPFVAYGTQKLSIYLKTWCTNSYNDVFSDPDNLANAVVEQLRSIKTLDVTFQKQLVLQSFKKMTNIIEKPVD